MEIKEYSVVTLSVHQYDVLATVLHFKKSRIWSTMILKELCGLEHLEGNAYAIADEQKWILARLQYCI